MVELNSLSDYVTFFAMNILSDKLFSFCILVCYFLSADGANRRCPSRLWS